MTIKDMLRSNFPSSVNKEGEIFSAMVVNTKGTAAIEKQLTDIDSFQQEWCLTPDVYDQSGTMLEKTVTFFSYLERFTDESDSSLKNRFKAIFVRNHDTVWGSPTNVKHVFQQYFPSANVFLVENTEKFDDSELLDGDFTSTEGSAWTFNNCSITKEARFSKTYGVTLVADSDFRQTVTLTAATTYCLHWFMNGKCSVEIKDSDGNYWDNENQKWLSSETENSFDTGSDWNNNMIHFTTGENTEITVIFKGSEKSFVDYIRLFQKYQYGSFSVLLQFTGDTNSNSLTLAPGKEDTEASWHENASYYEKSYMSGVASGFAMDIYEDLLEYLKTTGVKAFLEIINRDYIEGE